ncbi:hypothetical protein NDU88_004335 [Pleurodeles waltl]|uniref:Uncharacterized protein n=1 Tax=Pleurodeles waltl TaxID=8319 RepID=A0AAV7W7J7_PLEWA|nr:hypothetical protein NDU88_004335 [Pleurodeles waltl]
MSGDYSRAKELQLEKRGGGPAQLKSRGEATDLTCIGTTAAGLLLMQHHSRSRDSLVGPGQGGVDPPQRTGGAASKPEHVTGGAGGGLTKAPEAITQIGHQQRLRTY